ncbi:hypothetical protein Tco_1263827 [Tanacetum coccineum]
MAALKFADSHNMVAFLEKPTESSGFKEIVDFLNAHPIRYALTVNPTIYVSCIEQFWSTIKTKTINGETQIHALVDGKKIVITESSVRKDLQFADEDGIDCLSNTTIFDNLKLMGFLQVFLDKQLDKVPSHNAIFSAPCYTKKVFANIKRTVKDFSGKVTPLFDTMLIQNQADVGKGSGQPTTQRTPISDQPSITEQIIAQSLHQPKKTHKPRKPKSKVTQIPQSGEPIEPIADEIILKERGDYLERATTTTSSLEAEQELMEFCTKLQQRVLDMKNTKTAQAQEITSLKLRVKKLEKKGGSRTHKLKRLYKGRYGDDLMFDTSDLAGEKIFVVEQGVPNSKKNDVVSTAAANPITTASVEVTTANATTIISDDLTLAQTLIEIRSTRPKAKGIVFREQGESTTITIRPQQEPLKDKDMDTELVKGSEKRAGEELMQESGKKQKVCDDTEEAKLNDCMEIVSDEEEIHKEGQTSYYQITRADGSSKMYLVFSQLLKSFDKEDLETLWRLVKAKHGYTRPEEGYKRVLWDDLKIMFKTHVEDGVWRNLQGNKVLVWKLFDSFGVHFVRFQNLHIYMLVKKRNETHKEEWKQYYCARCLVCRLEVQRSSRYGSIIIIIIAAAWSKVCVLIISQMAYNIWRQLVRAYNVVTKTCQNLAKVCDFYYGAQWSHLLSLSYVHAPLEMKVFVTTADHYYYCLFIFLLLRFIFLIVRNGGQFEYWNAGLVVVVYDL